MNYYLGLLLLLTARGIERIDMYIDSCSGVAPNAGGVRLRRYPARGRGCLPVPDLSVRLSRRIAALLLQRGHVRVISHAEQCSWDLYCIMQVPEQSRRAGIILL